MFLKTGSISTLGLPIFKKNPFKNVCKFYSTKICTYFIEGYKHALLQL